MRVKIDLLSYCFDTIINLLGIIFNSVLLYIVWRHTPRKMHTYSVLIVNTIIADFTIALCGFLTSNRIIPSGQAIVFISNGPCVHLGSRACLVIYETLLHALEHGLMSQFISFSYRYYILVSTRIPRRRQLAAICLAVYAPSFLLYVIHIRHSDDPELLKEMVMKHHPTYNLTGYTVSGHYPFTEPTTLLTVLYLFIPNIPLYILIGVLRHKTLRILKDASIKFKRSNRKMHIQLMKVHFFKLYSLTYSSSLTNHHRAFFSKSRTTLRH
ncbi:7TM chemoreceptor [Necator americanus]|uniref:7TM chemoreceptor n=1 Tax=Necator americanus TaxID=51031 RepID=W2TER7_NECAM|nr:7TM chemoreceptor [Necator americanus]ETN80089.1 7TM chemoreceptor [Necator americanus]